MDIIRDIMSGILLGIMHKVKLHVLLYSMALYFGDFPIKMVVFTLAGDLVHTYDYNLLKWPTLSKSAFTVLSKSQVLLL